MGTTLIRARPQAPPDPFQSTPIAPSTGSQARDFFERVVRPARFDPSEKEVAAELRKRIVEWQSHESEWLANTDFEFAFLSGDHWVEEVGQGQDRGKQLRAQGRSAFVIDLLTPSVELIVNQARINKTTAAFVPTGDAADMATAEVRQGLYRNIERVSKAAIARETAYQMAVSVGRGYTRVMIEDEEGGTFAKRISIKRVDNLHSVAIDPTCLDFTYGDAEWAYTFDDVWKDKFRAECGRAADGSDIDLDTSGLLLDDSQRNYWFPKDKVKVGEYFRRRWRKREVLRLSDGTECWKEEAPAGYVLADDGRPNIKSKLDSSLEWRKMTGTQTLEMRVWPGRLIPIVVYIGREVFRGKKPKIHSGMVRPAMHPSQIHDYMVSRSVDEVALSPLPHMFSATGHFGVEQKQIINDINRHPWSNVEYTPQEDSQGRALPPPGWASPSPNIAAVVQAEAGSKDNLQRVLNTFAPQLGALQGQQSGRAITQVKDSGDISHAAFPDNYNRAQLQEAEIVNELMDVVYTEKQAITITEPDDKTKTVLINQEYTDKKTGKVKKHMFGGAQYGVAITTGPSYPSRMAEAATRLLDLAKIIPEPIVRVLDLLVKDLGIPNADKYADRFRPPGFTDDEDGPDIHEITQQRDQAVQTLDQAHQLIAQLMQKVEQLGSAEAMKRLEIASKERIAAASDRTTIFAAEIAAKQQDAHAVLLTELEAILKQLEFAQDVQKEAAATSDATAAPPAGGAPGATPPQGAPPPLPGAPSTGMPQPSGAPPTVAPPIPPLPSGTQGQ